MRQVITETVFIRLGVAAFVHYYWGRKCCAVGGGAKLKRGEGSGVDEWKGVRVRLSGFWTDLVSKGFC